MNVIFDLGGVVVRWAPEQLLAELFSDADVRDRIRSGLLRHRDWQELDRGTLSVAEAVRRTAERTGLPRETIARFLDQVPAALAPIPTTVELLRDLQRLGHTLYRLSNMHRTFIDHLDREHDVWDMFAGGVISCHVHLVKPEPAIFEHLLARYGLDPASTVFVDDDPQNVRVATELGLRGIRFEDAAQCRRALANLGCASTS